MFSLQISFQLEMTLILATEILMKSSEWGLGKTFLIGIGFFHLLNCLSYLVEMSAKYSNNSPFKRVQKLLKFKALQ